MPSKLAKIAQYTLSAGLLAMLAACSSSTSSSTGSVKAFATPTASVTSVPMTICSGFGCVFKDKFQFSAANKEQLAKIMAQGNFSPEAERRVVAKVIGVMENMTRSRIRFPQDVEKAYQRQNGRRGQMDCVDESLNTTAYLQYLFENGMLKYHKPRRYYAERGLLIDGRYPHKSAVMIESNGERWSVDSWYGKGGEPAQVMPLKKWRKVRDSTFS